MKNHEYPHPFTDRANRLAHMPWTMPGYRPIVAAPSFFERLKELLK